MFYVCNKIYMALMLFYCFKLFVIIFIFTLNFKLKKKKTKQKLCWFFDLKIYTSIYQFNE